MISFLSCIVLEKQFDTILKLKYVSLVPHNFYKSDNLEKSKILDLVFGSPLPRGVTEGGGWGYGGGQFSRPIKANSN